MLTIAFKTHVRYFILGLASSYWLISCLASNLQFISLWGNVMGSLLYNAFKTLVSGLVGLTSHSCRVAIHNNHVCSTSFPICCWIIQWDVSIPLEMVYKSCTLSVCHQIFERSYVTMSFVGLDALQNLECGCAVKLWKFMLFIAKTVDANNSIVCPAHNCYLFVNEDLKRRCFDLLHYLESKEGRERFPFVFSPILYFPNN